MVANSTKIKESRGDRIAKTVFIVILTIMSLIFLYPLVYVFSMSVSDVVMVASRKVTFFPKGFSLDAYQVVFEKPDVWLAYGNTIWYTVVGTVINVILTMLFAYPISRVSFVLKKQLTIMMAITMWFSGGMIPSFILVNKLGLYGSRWAMVLPGAILAWNVIITKTFLQSNIPDALVESGKIDGANDFIIFARLVLPLSKSIIAVNVLFYAVGHWNEYFNALLYLPKKELQPLQIFLRNILFAAQMMADAGVSDSSAGLYLLSEKIKYATIMVAILPILCVYPFVQKHFVKGVMVGSIKG